MSFERFESKFVRGSEEDCWNWTAGTHHGYGWFGLSGGPDYAHRIAFRLYIGPIPTGMFVCHTCDNRLCCNPKHFFIGTHFDNQKDKILKGRQQKGEDYRSSKLTSEKVKNILADNRSTRVIASSMGIGKSLVSAVKRGERWKHVPR